jgi:carbonic anhydrase
MEGYRRLLDYNARWVKERLAERVDYFTRLEDGQRPEFLWIGCSDSRVPAETVTGCEPGELFVHRNVANLVVHTDLNLMSVLHFAVEQLHVEHVIVCGHYGCGGVSAALEGARHGLIDNWLQHVADVAVKHAATLDALPTGSQLDRLCELNVVEQVANVCRTTVVRDAWKRDQPVTVHGLVYGLHDGLLRDLGVATTSPA